METEQMKFWKSNFGDVYTVRNSEDFDTMYKNLFGITRSEMIAEFLSTQKKSISILEVGCNRGNQLKVLASNDFSNLWGMEINKGALSAARNDKRFNIVEGTAFDIPFKDGFFDMVFTSGVLIHIAPKDLPKAIDEIYRVSKKLIWGFEYFSKDCQEIIYRGHPNKLWKNDFLKVFLSQYPNLKVLKQKSYPYLDDDNVDMMYLIEKS